MPVFTEVFKYWQASIHSGYVLEKKLNKEGKELRSKS